MPSKVQFDGKPLIASKYLEAADLGGRKVTVIIERIVRGVEFHNRSGGKDKKPVFYLRGKEKGWALNVTNLNRIAEVHGPKADTWIGKPVVLTTERVDSFGSMVPAVRVDVDETRRVFERGPSNRANGNGKRPGPAPDQSRQKQTAKPRTQQSSDSDHDEYGEVRDRAATDVGDADEMPDLPRDDDDSDEHQEAIAESDVPY